MDLFTPPCTSWNEAAERMYGYTASEAVGQPITLIFPPSRQDEFAAIMEQMTRGERVNNYETRRLKKDGGIITVSITVSPMKDSKGNIIGASAIARDITQQKRVEAEVRQSKQQLEVILSHIADGITIHGASHTHIVGDSDRLEQVFTNLINNAVKYSPQAKHVDIFITASQNTVTVSIRDDGIGIPQEHQQKIFDRF